MPDFDEADIRVRIAESEIKFFSIDTNIVDGLNRSGQLNHPILRSVAKLSDKGIGYVLSDVVVGEVGLHIEALHRSAVDELFRQLKTYGRVWSDQAGHIDVFKKTIASPEAIASASGEIVTNYLKESSVIVLKSGEHCNIEALLGDYFSGQPPFAGGTKKFEFPDAIALAGLESWASKNGACLVVSKDKGWQSYCNESEYLYCCNDLSKGLGLFHEDEALVELILAQAQQNEQLDLIALLTSAAQSDLDDQDFEINADAFMNWECQLEHAIVNEVRLLVDANSGQEIVATDADTVTFVLAFEADIEVVGGFDFSVYDSIDKDDVMIGGALSTANLTHRYTATVTASGKGETEGGNVDVFEATVNPNSRLRHVDFGTVEPFFEPDPEEF